MSLPYQGVGDTTYYNNDYNVTACTGQSTVTETQGSPVSVQGPLWERCAGILCICAHSMRHEAHAAASQLDVSPKRCVSAARLHEQQDGRLRNKLTPGPMIVAALRRQTHFTLFCMKTHNAAHLASQPKRSDLQWQLQLPMQMSLILFCGPAGLCVCLHASHRRHCLHQPL